MCLMDDKAIMAIASILGAAFGIFLVYILYSYGVI